MNPIFRDLLGMAPGLIAGLRDPQAGSALMEGWERARREHEIRARQQQQDALGLEDRRLALEDRQRTIGRQAHEDARSAEVAKQQDFLRSQQAAGELTQTASSFDDPSQAKGYIESMMPNLMSVFGQGSMALGQPAVEQATRVITGRQKKQVEAYVEQALKTSFVADNPDADPELQLPEHLSKLMGKPSAKLSELQQFAQLPIGKPAAKKSTANPTAASLAYEAAGGDPSRALELLRPPKAESGESKEPLMAIMGDDGQPVYVPRSQAVGKRPASSREQGRAVTSGDAADIAEFNTALDDVATVRETLKGNKATGTSAAVGAAVPNAITELTGLGTDAKQKNAVIARVKQVIGKALEGGVLRKEDESKYAKILPTISDIPEVVATKLDGLERAIRQRQQNKLDALADAGYDISRFASRKPAASPAAPATPAPTSGPRVGERRSFNGTLAEWDGKGWKKVAP